MSQAGYTPIQLYYSTTAAATPSAGNLANGELAINITDGKLFYKDNGGVVRTLATKGSVITPLTNNGVVYVNGSGQAVSGSALTFDGTNLTLGGGYMSLNGNGYFRTDISGYLAMQAGSTGYVWRSTGNAGDWMTLTSTGLGIGTSSPASKLDVYSTGNTTLTISGSSGGGGDVSQIDFFRIGSNVTSSVKAIRDGGNTSGALTFYTALSGSNTERMRLDSSGNLGLGVTPSAWSSSYTAFQTPNGGAFWSSKTGSPTVVTSANAYFDGSSYRYLATYAATLAIQSGGQHQWYNAPSGTAGNAITFTQAMTLDASGNLQLGTTSGTGNRLNVVGSGGIRVNEDGAGTKILTIRSDYAGVGPAINVTTNDPLLFLTNNTERARIDSSGNLLVGTTSSSGTVVGTRVINSAETINCVTSASTNGGRTSYEFYSTGAGAYRFYVGAGGTVYATSTSISAISDRTLKENIHDLETGLTEVLALKPRRFDWKNGDAQNVAGFVAQEVEEVLPELVTDYVYNKDEEGNDIIKKSLKMGDILPTLVKAIQEQQAIIEQLKADVAALKAN